MNNSLQEYYDDEFKNQFFDFFFKFSRFEFALKASGFITTNRYGSVSPGWNPFIIEFQDTYCVDDYESELLAAPPNVQTYSDPDITWQPYQFHIRNSELKNITLALRAMRNNLFHGGKFGDRSLDNAERTKFLLLRGEKILDKFSELRHDLHAHYYEDY